MADGRQSLKERREMLLSASICSISGFYMDIKVGQAEVPFAQREDNVHLSLCSRKEQPEAGSGPGKRQRTVTSV